jgi:hypothetical protein
MESRESPRRVTQRQLEVPAPPPAEPATEPAAEPVAEPHTSPEPVAARPPISREPSEATLRERQQRWLRERARFEASQAKDRRVGEGTK